LCVIGDSSLFLLGAHKDAFFMHPWRLSVLSGATRSIMAR
jgi:hypothetical protein